ncbi:hypothetical protein [Streptomyces sp. NPDC055099]
MSETITEHEAVEEPVVESAAKVKCVYMALMSLDPTGKGRRRWTMRWKARTDGGRGGWYANGIRGSTRATARRPSAGRPASASLPSFSKTGDRPCVARCGVP